eukprot:184071_1
MGNTTDKPSDLDKRGKIKSHATEQQRLEQQRLEQQRQEKERFKLEQQRIEELYKHEELEELRQEKERFKLEQQRIEQENIANAHSTNTPKKCVTVATTFIEQIVKQHSRVSSTIDGLKTELPFINDEQCYGIINGVLQHNTELALHNDYDTDDPKQTSRKSLDDIQDEYFMHFKHPPRDLNHMFNYCQMKASTQKEYEWPFFEIKDWWADRPEPKAWWDQQHPLVSPSIDISKTISSQSTTNHIPLTQFTADDMVNSITNWIQHDIDYQFNISQTKTIFSKHELSGEKMTILSGDDAKRIVKDKMLEFIALSTLNIMFDGLDKWKEGNQENLQSKSSDQIAQILFEYPLRQLITRIKTEGVDGQAFIKSVNKINIIQQETGWKEDEIEQIHSVLFKAMVLSEDRFKRKLGNDPHSSADDDDDKSIEIAMAQIKQIMNTYGVEQLQYDIKHNKNTDTFNAQVINIIHDIDQGDDREDDVIQNMYKSIAQCFAFDYKSTVSMNDELDLAEPRDWICSHCGNYNFSKYINGNMNHRLEWCTLCGVSQIESITMKIRNEDTFIMVNSANESRQNTDTDEYDTRIKDVLSYYKIKLVCPNQSDETQSQCDSMVRLAKELIRYNEYLQSLDQSNTKTTLPKHVDIPQLIDNDTYKMVYRESLKSITRFSEDEQTLFLKMLDENIDGMSDINTFLETDVKSFKKKVKLHLGLKPSFGFLLWKRINANLKRRAQRLQFDEYLSDLDMDTVDKDYHHILKSHIQNGSKNNIKNAFLFFGKVVHFRDKVTAACKSLQRKADRAKQLKQMRDRDVTVKQTQLPREIKNIWNLKQNYNQTQLDIIHSYLVHSKSKDMVQLYTTPNPDNEEGDHKQDHEDQMEDEEEDDETPTDADVIENKDRYISFGAEYGFGVMHEYHHLKPIYVSMYDEMLNGECPLDEIVFHNLLTKAIKKHKIALSKDYVKKFVCKYYNKRYRIIRNEPISIQHIFAIVAYTDMTAFCTAFRKTYRRITKDETDEDVTKRHVQLYYYSRGLFESIEFFGSHMNEQLTVYHGLNREMTFIKFTAYFNQPISSTTSFRSAQQFSVGSGGNSGIILTLRSGAKHKNEPTKIPKYLSVSWLSAFPNEDERLFYGAYVVFKITNI